MCKNRPLELKGTRSYKILLLNEVDRLSREAQHSLRRTMEKYSSTCRLIFSCSNVSKASRLSHWSALHLHTAALHVTLCPAPEQTHRPPAAAAMPALLEKFPTASAQTKYWVTAGNRPLAQQVPVHTGCRAHAATD